MDIRQVSATETVSGDPVAAPWWNPFSISKSRPYTTLGKWGQVLFFDFSLSRWTILLTVA